MTDEPMDGKPPRTAPRARDWFAPPGARHSGDAGSPGDGYIGPPPQPPQIPIPGILLPPRDRRVWPPEEPESEDRSTQPFPAVRENRPLPMPLRRSAPQSPVPAEAAATEDHAPDDQAPKDEAQADEAAPVRRRSRRRAVLLGAGAVVAVGLAVGVPAWYGYNVFASGRPADHVHVVAAGQPGVLQHVSWQVVGVERMPNPQGGPEAPDRQWLKVVATRTALDAEGATRHGAPDVKLVDRTGRTWRTEMVSNETPLDGKDNQVGMPYRMELAGVVPPSVADQVEVLLRPSPARDVPGQSAADMMKSAAASTEKNDQVLRFRR